MAAAYGVHFGCTSACLAVNKDEKTDVIANDLGDRTTPCIVAFTDHDQAVGIGAKQGMIRNLQNTVCHVKQILGRKCDDPVVTDYKRKSAVQVLDQGGNPMYEVEIKEARKLYSPLQIAVSIYKKMLETAQSHGGSGSQDSVLAVPTHFNAEQKRAISMAANEAGFNVLRLISEPSAALLAYDIGQTDITYNRSVLVYRMGGLSSEVSIVNVHNGMYRILTDVTNSNVGGDMFTNELCKHLVTEFKRKSRCDISDNKRAMTKLHRQAEICKHTMSKLDNVHCAVDSLYDGIDFDAKVSRARYESCISELVQKCSQFIDQVLTDNNLTRTSVDKVILCGGGTNTPLLQRTINDMFSHCDVLSSINPEEVIAVGAAKQAGILSTLEDEDIKLNIQDKEIDCISKPICIKQLLKQYIYGTNPNEIHSLPTRINIQHLTIGPNSIIKTKTGDGIELSPIFPALAPLHSRKHLEFILQDDQTSFKLDICECIDQDNIVSLAKVIMRDLPAGSTINSTFHLRRDGHLHITCTEKSSNKTESITVEPS